MKLFIMTYLLLFVCLSGFSQKFLYVSQQYTYPDYYKSIVPFLAIDNFIADEIVYPVNHGKLDGYHDANPFQRFSYSFSDKHLGADINGNEMGDSDLGDTIYCIGNGIVTIQIGSILQVLHNTPERYIVSHYRHCQELFVDLGQKVYCRQPIGTIGNENGAYLNAAHLHFEIRTNPLLDVGGGYGEPEGYVDPMKFIKNFKTKERSSNPGSEIFYKSR